MKQIFTILLCLLFSLSTSAERQRVLVLTDIENEPDDAMSMVRFLTYCNQWDVEGLIATTSIHQQNKTAAWRIKEIVEAYGKVQPNLLKHEKGYPTAESLLAKIKSGLPTFGMKAVGKGMDSEASEWIIDVVDRKDDNRPVWVLVWGGPNCLAQALWKVKNTRTPSQLTDFIKKLRVYTISDQDDSGPWLRRTFPDLFYIVSPGYHAYGAYHYCTWSGISGDKFHGRFSGADFNLVSNKWLDENIRCKGPLGAQYPQVEYLMEGDSPTFMYLIDNGLSYPEHPDWGSWGGRYELYNPGNRKWFGEPETRPIWTDAMDEVYGKDKQWHTTNKATIWRWRDAYQNDFSARMDWTIKDYKDCNHAPIAKASFTKQGKDTILLNAEGSSDPDGNTLSYHWFCYQEAGTFALQNGRSGEYLRIKDSDKPQASFVISRPQRQGTLHIILEVTDNGKPALTRYARLIINTEKEPTSWAYCATHEGGLYNLKGGKGGQKITLASNGEDMYQSLLDAIRNYDIIEIDGSKGALTISRQMELEDLSHKTIIGINNARLKTSFTLNKAIHHMLDTAKISNYSSMGEKGKFFTLSNGKRVKEECEYQVRQHLIDFLQDEKETYQAAGLFSLIHCEDIIMQDLTLQGPGAIDVGGKDLLNICHGSQHILIDHCNFIDGIDGNFDINSYADFITISNCTFSYTDLSYNHMNTNLIGSGDNAWMNGEEALNVTFQNCIWGKGCNQRMPMVRFGKIHLLNCLYDCPGCSRTVNPRYHSEVLIEGCVWKKGVKNIFSETDATAYQWKDCIFEEKFTPKDKGTVTVPYKYTAIPAKDLEKKYFHQYIW